MHQSTPASHGNSRVFIACLLSFAILMTPIAAVAASTRARTAPAKGAPKQLSPEQKLEASLFKPALAPIVGPNITATKTDTYTNSPGAAFPGDEITYDVAISNSGTDAANVQFSDTIDANTTLVPGSLKVSPVANPDNYATGQDVPLAVSNPGVLTNDTGTPAPTAVAIAAGPTTQGGTVTLNTDGSFNYTPASGFSGQDTFTYTGTNGFNPNDTATVTITVDAAPTVTSTTPTNGATGVATDANIVINFSESVNATTSSFTVECPGGSPQTFTIGSSPATSFTLNPSSDLPVGTTCTVTV